jgi:hypothetical protein
MPRRLSLAEAAAVIVTVVDGCAATWHASGAIEITNAVKMGTMLNFFIWHLQRVAPRQRKNRLGFI